VIDPGFVQDGLGAYSLFMFQQLLKGWGILFFVAFLATQNYEAYG
jgi:hypothetical protein